MTKTPNKFEVLKLGNQLCFPLYACAKEVIRIYRKPLEKIGLTYTQYIVMMYFWEKKESNVKELGNAILLDSSTLTPVLKKLEEKGFIKRERSKEDERNLIIRLTEEGEKLKDKALDIPAKMGKCINLTEEEAKAFYSLIYKVLVNVKNEK